GDYCSRYLYKCLLNNSPGSGKDPGGAQFLEGKVSPRIAAGIGPRGCEREPRQVVVPASSMQCDGLGLQAPVREPHDGVLAVGSQRDLHQRRLGWRLEQRSLPTPREDDPSRSIDLDELTEHRRLPGWVDPGDPAGTGVERRL